MAGLRVLRLTSDMVSDEWVERIIRYCRSLGGDGLCGGDILTFAGGEGPDCGENGDELLVSPSTGNDDAGGPGTGEVD